MMYLRDLVNQILEGDLLCARAGGCSQREPSELVSALKKAVEEEEDDLTIVHMHGFHSRDDEVAKLKSELAEVVAVLREVKAWRESDEVQVAFYFQGQHGGVTEEVCRKATELWKKAYAIFETHKEVV